MAATGPAIAPPPQAVQAVPFSLVPAIFTPFSLPAPNEPNAKPSRPGGSTEKLRIILKRLDAQHNAVRRNMIHLISVEKARIIREAKAKRALQAVADGSDENDKKPDKLVGEREIDDLLARLRANVKDAGDGKEFESDGDFDAALVAAKAAEAGVDIAMTGTDGAGEEVMLKRKYNERTEMSHKLQDLVLWAKDQMEGYDRHASGTRNYYENALARRVAKELADIAGDSGVTAIGESADGGSRRSSATGGILANKNDNIRIDKEALARMEEETEMDLDELLGQSKMSAQPQMLPPSSSSGNTMDVSRNPRRR